MSNEMKKIPFDVFENSIVVLADDETYTGLDSTHVIVPKNETAANYIEDIRPQDIIWGDWESVNTAVLLDDEEVPMLGKKDYEVLSIRHLVQFYMANREKNS